MKLQIVFSLMQHKNNIDFIFGYHGPEEMIWNNKKDLEYFKQVTLDENKRSIIIMGSNTFCSLKRKLSGREHFVISSKNNLLTKNNESPDRIISNIEELKVILNDLKNEDNLISIIGGFELIKLLQNSINVNEIYLTIFYDKFFNSNINENDIILVKYKELQNILINYNLIDEKELDKNVINFQFKKR